MAIFKLYKKKRIERSHPEYKRAAWWASGMVEGVRYNESLKKKGVKTREEAEAEEDLIIASIRQGKYDIERRKTNYSDFVDKTYLPHAALKNESYKTKIGETNKLKEFFGKTPIRQVTVARCEAFKMWRVKQFKICQKCVHKVEHECEPEIISKSAVNRELATHSAVMSLAVMHRETQENPMRFVSKFKEPSPRDRLLSVDEKIRLLNELQNNIQLLSIVILTLLTGWRKDQILHLKCEDLDADFTAVKIKASKRSPARKIGVNPLAWQILTYLSERVNNQGWLFLNSRTGERLINFKKSWELILTKAKLENFQFRDLRHVFATNLLSSGADMRIIQAAMGHSRIKTSEIYAQVQDSSLRKGLDALADDKLLMDSFPSPKTH